MVRRVAMVFGIVFLVVGILGLVSTGGMQMGAEPPPAMILGMFPTNLLHSIVHLLFGVWGIWAARSFAGAKMYTQVGGVVYIVLAICGLLIPNTFGLIPNGGNNVWLHAVAGLVLAWAGFMAKEGMGAAAPAPGAMKM